MEKLSSLAALTDVVKGAKNLLNLHQLKILKPSREMLHLPRYSKLLDAFGNKTEGCDEGADRLPNFLLSGRGSDLQKALWHWFVEFSIHQVLSAEFIDELVKLIHGGKRILELGAGNGVLTAHLKRKSPCEKITFLASDDYSSKIAVDDDVQVLRLEFGEALNTLNPDIVVVSWMPPGVDFTKAIRSTQSVKKYILIGEVDSSTCGESWATWGVPPTIGCKRCEFEGCPRCDFMGIVDQTEKPWGQDWVRSTEKEASRYSFCRFDLTCGGGGNSEVVQMVRQK